MTSTLSVPALERLRVAAAVTSGWPTLRVVTNDEAAMLEARRIAEAVLGPLPQADEWEPWEEGDAWELVVDLPGAQATELLTVLEALEDFDASVVPGCSPGLRWALDHQVAVPERRGPADLPAVLYVDPAVGGDGRLDVRRGRPDDAVQEVERELALALSARDLPPFFSDRGPDTVEAVVHRTTGRVGVRLVFPSGIDDWEHAIVEAIGDVVRERADHRVLRLAPDLPRWDAAYGFAVTVWLVAACAAALPGDHFVEPSAEELTRMLHGVADLVDHLELQVVGKDHDAIADAVHTWLGNAALGGLPRWVDTPAQFAACWTLASHGIQPRALADAVERLRNEPAIDAVRLVPAEPIGLGERWQRLDPSWRTYGDMAFLRLYDPVADRDVLPDVDGADTPVWAQWLSTVPGIVAVRGQKDPDGRLGARLDLVPEAVSPSILDGVLANIAMARGPEVSTVAWWGYRHGRAIVGLREIRRPDS